MIGLSIYTHHTTPDGLCNDTAGLYVRHGEWAGGVLKNSECRVGAWGAWAPETNTLINGTIRAKAGLMLGFITGYKSADVLPLVSPSIAIGWRSTWLRASYLPRAPGAQSDGWHFSIEYDF